MSAARLRSERMPPLPLPPMPSTHPDSPRAAFACRDVTCCLRGEGRKPRTDERFGRRGRRAAPKAVEQEEEGSEESQGSLSSGLSPRGEALIARKPFDFKGAKMALAEVGHTYADAKATRTQGGGGTYVDDLQIRLAYEQLSALGGMASKVQDAIAHNKRIFEQTVNSLNNNDKRRVFAAWRGVHFGSIEKQKKIRKVLGRMYRFRQYRIMQRWKERVGIMEPKLRMQRKAESLFKKGLAKRCLQAWAHKVEENFHKEQSRLKESETRRLQNRIRQLERRAIRIFDNRRLARIWYAWDQGALTRQKKRQKMRRAFQHMRKIAYNKGWNTWYSVCQEKRRRQNLLRRALLRIKNLKLSQSFVALQAHMEKKKAKRGKALKAVKFMQKRLVAMVWNSWTHYIARVRFIKKAVNMWKRPHLSRAFNGFTRQLQYKRRVQLIMARAVRRLTSRRMCMGFYRWTEAVEEIKLEKEGLDYDTVYSKISDMKAENEKLQRDNERFVRIIDSGDWGRSRVNELVKAGELLKTERETLSSLLNEVKREYTAVRTVKETKEEEIRGLKDRMLSGNFVQRNKMLVKGASSFNALVRALKQDIVETRPSADSSGPQTDRSSGSSDPNVLFEVDKLSMDTVTVFPDGELSVQAVKSQREPFDPRTSAPPLRKIRKPAAFSGGRSSTVRHPCGRDPSRSGEDVVNALQSLSPTEVDKLEQWLRTTGQPSSAGASRPQGLSSTMPR